MSAPKTWATAELVTASLANSEWRDRFTQIGAKAILISLGDPGGAVITTGVKRKFDMPWGMRVTGWTIYSDQVGSIVLDVWKTPYASAPPTVANTITGSEKPTLAAAQKNQDLTLTTWTTDIAQGDCVAVNVDSCTSIKAVSLTIRGVLLDYV